MTFDIDIDMDLILVTHFLSVNFVKMPSVYWIFGIEMKRVVKSMKKKCAQLF